MSHDSDKSGHGYRGNHNSETPVINGISPVTDISSHSAQFMDGTTQFEIRTAHSNRGRFGSAPHGKPMSAYFSSLPQRTHHRTHSASDDTTENSQPYIYGHTTSAIGPSASIPEHIGQTNGVKKAAFGTYTEDTDGLWMSKQYDVSSAETYTKTPKVELLTYKSFPESDEVGMVGMGEEQEARETDMTLSQQDFVTDLDAKIRSKKNSVSAARTPKTSARPTKATIEELMNMTPEKKKKSSHSDAKRQTRNSVHGVPWKMDNELEQEESKREHDIKLEKKLEKKRQRLGRTASAVQLVGYRRKGDHDVTPSIPEVAEGDRQNSTRQFSSSPVVVPQNARTDTVSASSSYEFHSHYSPSLSSTHQRSLSPTQELMAHMETRPTGGGSFPKSVAVSESFSNTTSSNSRFEQGLGRTVYRQNLADTHLSDVAVFGKHFDPSQATQERMEANVGDVGSIGLNTNTSPLRKKEEERGRKREERERMDAALPSSGSSLMKENWTSRTKSASVSPKRRNKGDREARTRLSSLKSGDSNSSEREKLPSWETELPPHVSLPSSVISTPSRYSMFKVSRNFRNPQDNSDVEMAKGSMPNLYQPSKNSVSPPRELPPGVKEGSPDDSWTSDEEKPKKRRSIGFSLGRKLSTSMREIFAKDKKNPTTGTTWQLVTAHLYPAPSEPQLSVLTEQERREILEETEILPRTRSTELLSSHQSGRTGTVGELPAKGENPLGHLFVPPTSIASGVSNPDSLGLSAHSNQNMPTGFYEERSVDGYNEKAVDVSFSNQKPKSEGSDCEYETALESEESYAKSTVNIITVPAASDSALREAGYFTASAGMEGHKGGATPRTGLPTIKERSSPQKEMSGPGSYEIPLSEGDPIAKTLNGVLEKSNKSRNDKDTSDGKKTKSKLFAPSKAKEKNTEEVAASVKKEDPKKEKKPLFRFSKQLTIVQRRTPSPRPVSPSSSSPSGGSRQSSGRYSPSRKPSTASSTSSQKIQLSKDSNDKTRRTSKTSLESSPRGSFREGQVSPFSRDFRVSPRGSPRGSPMGSSRGVQSSPAPSVNSPRGSGRGTSSPMTPSGISSPRGRSQRDVNSSTPGLLNSPRGSFRREANSPTGRGSPRGSMRGNITSPNPSGWGPPTAQSPSPRSSVRRESPSTKTSTSFGASRLTSHTHSPNSSKRRLSEPVSPSGSPLAVPKRSPSERMRGNTSSMGGKPKPARRAPPPPLPLPKSGTTPSLSQGSSQTSTVTPPSANSSSSSPRQRRTGVSLPESPLTPKRVSEVLLHVPAPIGEEGHVKEDVTTQDEVGKLLTTVGEKLAPLSASPEEPNPLDVQSQFEIPPPLEVLSPPAVAKMPADVFAPSQDSQFGDDLSTSQAGKDIHVTPEDSPAPVRRGLRPRNVISVLIGGRKKTGRESPTPATKSKGNVTTAAPSGLQQTGRGSFRKSKMSTPAMSYNPANTESGRVSPSVSSGKRNSVPALTVQATKQQQQKSTLATGLPPRAPSVKKVKSNASTGRSQSTVEVPSIRVTEARKSIRKTSTPSAGSLTSTGPRSLKLATGSQSLVRSSIRVSGKLKKNNPMSPEHHRKVSSLTRPKSGDRPPSQGSVHTLPRNSITVRSSVRRPSRVAPVAPGRASMRKVSSGGEVLNRNTNTLEKRRPSVLSKSMRKTSMTPTQMTAGNSLSRNAATRSMRMSSSRKVSALGTMPRSSVVSRLGSTGSAGSLQSTPVRKSMRKTSNTKDVFEVFDQISADAKGNLLTSSDHRRAVRPKLRQKASASHLRILQDRKDITTELISPSNGDVSTGLDPNTYSTYMAKKNLAPSAVAGLAMKLDLTTVKLRKTGIVDKMLSGGVVMDLPNLAMGAEYDTKHTTLLLQIKGRRQVHTRLVEPSVTSMNSGDVYICVSGKSLYHWIGKSANVIEKARSSDVVMRMVHKKELGCQAMAPVVIKEELRQPDGSAKIEKFWQLLGGKKGIKSSESVPNDDLFEKSVNMVTTVMHLEGTDDKAHFTTIHENSNHMLKTVLLDTKKILLLDFHSEVYVWVGKMSPPKLRKKAIELAKKHFDAGCKPPVFTHQGAGGSTVIRSSGRYRAKLSTTHSPRNNTLNRSGRRMSRVKKEGQSPRPSWALFNRINEGSEHILFREKFSDWPEQGRIIKMKGHSMAPVMPAGPVELQPADVEKMLRPIPKFEGLRLEGDNVHRGQGNYMVSRSTFACNRVHSNKYTKWVIKDNENVVVPESDHGLFYVQEAYVIRWSYRITVVKELEGLTPGEGMFARDRKLRKEMNGSKNREVSDAEMSKIARGNDSSDTESEDEEERDDESKRILESGGRDKVAYFFWQGDNCTLNEKGASALLTVELDKERGPQIRVLQNKEPPAFLNLFAGGMVLLNGRSDTLHLKSPARPTRLFLVRGQMRNEACLVEIDPEHWPIAKFFRSRGCYVVYDSHSNKIFLWKGCKITDTLRKVSHTSVRLLKRRLKADLVMVDEGQEPKDLCSLIRDKTAYESLLNDTRLQDFTPRLFELSSTTGEFVATEVLYNSRNTDIEASPFLQSDIYSASQPAIFLLDAYRVVYVWLGWWQQERRDWSIMRETNITTGSAHARWTRDKKLALETAQLYAKASTESRKHQPKTYLIHAGTEPDQFVNLFPFWKPNSKVQDLQCKGRKPLPKQIDVDEELLKYSRTQFTLKELQKRPLPEAVDPSKLETYISDTEFKAVFRITRDQFKQFPVWKQTEIKKRHGLF